MYNVYVDESCKDVHKFLVLGGLVVHSGEDASVCQSLQQVRRTHDTFGEVKWVKVSKSKLAFYKDFVDVFFARAGRDELHFHSLVVDTATFNHKKWNMGDAEIGFNKLIYQLLLHRFGKRYGHMPLHAYLDARSSKDSPEAIRPMLNAALAREGISGRPFKKIHFMQSHDSEVIQLNDLLIGALGFRRNGRQHLADASAHKKELAEYIARKVLTIQKERPNWSTAKRFTIWDFKFNR